MTHVFAIARPEDAASVAALQERAYRGDASRLGWTSEADLLDGARTSPQAIAAIIADPGARILVARDGAGAIAGCAVITRQEGRRALFSMFAVEPTLQGGGLGKALLARAEALAVELWDAQAMDMTVIEVRAELIAFYARRGYVGTGARKLLSSVHDGEGWTKGRDLVLTTLSKPLPGA
jgi:GNAT superfamily N-acetyltransferase